MGVGVRLWQGTTGVPLKLYYKLIKATPHTPSLLKLLIYHPSDNSWVSINLLKAQVGTAN